jgi:hypothetical protein
MGTWIKRTNESDSKTIFIEGKKKVKGRLWKLIIVTEEPEGITPVDNEIFERLSATRRKAKALLMEEKREKLDLTCKS